MDWPWTSGYVKATGEALASPSSFPGVRATSSEDVLRDNQPTAGVSSDAITDHSGHTTLPCPCGTPVRRSTSLPLGIKLVDDDLSAVPALSDSRGLMRPWQRNRAAWRVTA